MSKAAPRPTLLTDTDGAKIESMVRERRKSLDEIHSASGGKTSSMLQLAAGAGPPPPSPLPPTGGSARSHAVPPIDTDHNESKNAESGSLSALVG